MTTPETGAGRDKCGAETRSGRDCARPAGWGTPHPGIGRCKLHGGSTPSHVESALRTQAEAEVRKLWVGLDKAAPVKDPVGSLERLAGALEQAVDVVGGRVNELGNVAGGQGLTQLRGEVVLLERLLGQLRQALDAMARLGIAERHVELEQERAQLVTSAFLAALGVVSLLPADRDAMLRAFLGALGVGADVLEAGTGGAA